MKQFISISLLLISLCSIPAQSDIYIVPQVDGGIPFNSHSGEGDGLKTRINTYQLQLGLSGRIIFADKFGIELGISQNQQTWAMRDASFNSRNPGFNVYTNNTFSYYSLFGALQYNQYLSEFNALYVAAGYSINNIGGGNLTDNKLFVKNNEAFTVNSTFASQTQSVHAEIGFENPINKKDLIVYSLKFSYGLDNMLSGTYKATKEGTSLSDASYNSKGTFIGISLKYNFRLAHIPKRIRPANTDSLPTPVIKRPHIEIESKKEEKEKKRTEVPKTVAGRDVSVKKIVKSAAKTVTIRVYDSGNVDGDIVSLYFNETIIIENYELQKVPFVSTIELSEGKNIFTLHALNLGTVPPNTAAIIIDDGVKLHKVSLASTLKTSATVEIDYYPADTTK